MTLNVVPHFLGKDIDRKKFMCLFLSYLFLGYSLDVLVTYNQKDLKIALFGVAIAVVFIIFKDNLTVLRVPLLSETCDSSSRMTLK